MIKINFQQLKISAVCGIFLFTSYSFGISSPPKIVFIKLPPNAPAPAFPEKTVIKFLKFCKNESGFWGFATSTDCSKSSSNYSGAILIKKSDVPMMMAFSYFFIKNPGEKPKEYGDYFITKSKLQTLSEKLLAVGNQKPLFIVLSKTEEIEQILSY